MKDIEKIVVDSEKIEPIIKDVVKHNTTYAEKELKRVFEEYDGKNLSKETIKKIIFEAGTFGSLAREVLKRLIDKNLRPEERVSAYKIIEA